MKVTVRATGAVLGHASEQLLSNNIEAYETTIPELLSDRLRNPKFAPPENPQTGVALEWEPIGNTMTGFACRLVPGMYMSGREAQLIHNYTQQSRAGIVQAGVPVRAGELYEVEMWARAQHAPVTVSVALQLPGQRVPAQSQGELLYDLAHWHRRTCVLQSPGDGPASFQITVPGDSRVVIDQVHFSPRCRPSPARYCVSPVVASPAPITGSTGQARSICDRYATMRCSSTRFIMTLAPMSTSISVPRAAYAHFSPSTRAQPRLNKPEPGQPTCGSGMPRGGCRSQLPTSWWVTRTTGFTRSGT